MIKNDIKISYKYIKDNYTFPSKYITRTIEMLFKKKKLNNNSHIKSYKTSKIVRKPTSCKPKPDNNLKPLNEYKGKTGVYIFLDNDNIPVYIGVAGEKGSKQDLKKRLAQHFNCSSRLSKTIIEIENLLKNEKFEQTEDRGVLKKKLLEYAPKFLVIEVGALRDSDAVETSLDLEKCLIAIFNLLGYNSPTLGS